MVMRISSVQSFNNGVSGLQRNYANVTRTQEQISSGNRILTPADDPVASVRLLQLEQQQAVLAYTDAMTRQVQVPDAVFARVAALHTPQEVVEITATVAAYNMVSRFLEALQIHSHDAR